MGITLADLRAHLGLLKPKLSGAWVNKNSHYDGELADLLDMETATGRYSDASWRGLALEFKKGGSVWLDLVRYAEAQLGWDGARTETATLFFVPDRQRERIDEIVCVETRRLIAFLAITHEEAAFLADLAKRMRGAKRTLNAQARFKLAEARKIAAFVV